MFILGRLGVSNDLSSECYNAPQGRHQLVTYRGSKQIDHKVFLFCLLEIPLRGNISQSQNKALLFIVYYLLDCQLNGQSILQLDELHPILAQTVWVGQDLGQ